MTARMKKWCSLFATQHQLKSQCHQQRKAHAGCVQDTFCHHKPDWEEEIGRRNERNDHQWQRLQSKTHDMRKIGQSVLEMNHTRHSSNNLSRTIEKREFLQEWTRKDNTRNQDQPQQQQDKYNHGVLRSFVLILSLVFWYMKNLLQTHNKLVGFFESQTHECTKTLVFSPW